MFAKIESTLESENKRTVVLNFAYLSILQGVNFLLPLLTLPYLVRTLGAENFGLIAFSQAFIYYLVIFTDYGFNLSATRQISIHRENKEKISELFSAVMLIKLVFVIISFLLLTLIVFSIEKFRHDWLIFYLTFGIVIGNALFPVWFFQGMEKMKYITFLNILSKLIFTALIFAFVRNSSDFIYVPVINSIGFIVAGILALNIILKDFNLNLLIPKFKILIGYLKESTHYFLSKASISIFSSSNVFALGLFTSHQMVGIYSPAEKLYIALQSMYYPINDALFPYMSKERKISFYKKIFIITNIFNILLCIFTFIWAKEIIVLIFGQELQTSANILRIFCIATAISTPSFLLGPSVLAAFGRIKLYNASLIIGSLAHICGLAILAWYSRITIYNVAYLLIATESLIFLLRIYFVFLVLKGVNRAQSD